MPQKNRELIGPFRLDAVLTELLSCPKMDFDYEIDDVRCSPGVNITADDTNYTTISVSTEGGTVFTFTTKITGGVANADANVGDTVDKNTPDVTYTAANKNVAAGEAPLIKCTSSATSTSSGDLWIIFLVTIPYV